MINIGGVIGVNIGVAICCLFIGLHYGVQRSLERQRLSNDITDVYLQAVIAALANVGPEPEGANTQVSQSFTPKEGRMIRIELSGGGQTLVLGLSPEDLAKLTEGQPVIARGSSRYEPGCIVVTVRTTPGDIKKALEQVGIIPGHPHTT